MKNNKDKKMKKKSVIAIMLTAYKNNEISLRDATDFLYLLGENELSVSDVQGEHGDLQNIGFSNTRAEVCKHFDYWKTCESWTKDHRCLANCEYHLRSRTDTDKVCSHDWEIIQTAPYGIHYRCKLCSTEKWE